MKSLLDDPDVKGQVKLIYIDPPFATKQEFRGNQDQKAYQDKIAGAKFIEFLRKRLIFLRELLSDDDGSIYVHLDWKKAHYIKTIMDEIFMESRFKNEVIVRRTQKNYIEGEKINSLNVAFDSIFIYTKSNDTKFNPVYKDEKRKETWHAFDAPNWSGGRPNLMYELFGHMPPPNRCWAWTKEKAEKAEKGGKLRPNPRTGKPQYLIPERDKVICTNLWDDINAYSFKTGYPTEKNEKLIERILSMGSSENDIVLDAFAGSGTTLAVAEKLGRRWIGIDCGKLAIYTIQKRLLNLKTKIGNKGNPLKPKPFTLYHAGLYDFPKLRKLPRKDWRLFALHLFNCRDNKHTVSGIELDGYKGRSDVLVFNYQQEGGVVLDYGFVDDLHSMIGSKIGKQFFIIAPAASVVFLEDYVDTGSTRYYILRIPYSIINELHTRDFEAIQQPIDESHVNDTVDAVGFDFIRPPKAECEYSSKHLNDQLQEIAAIKIKTFKSEAMLKGASQLGNRESLSMVMVDFGYDGEIFNLDTVYYASEIEKNGWEAHLPIESIKDQMMIIYLDIYGNEYREIKSLDDFKSPSNEIYLKGEK